VIGLDVETIGLEPKRGNLRLIQTANGKGPHVYDAWDPKVHLDRVFALLATKNAVAHNANFEEACLREYGFEVTWMTRW
jgi:ribonuclease D